MTTGTGTTGPGAPGAGAAGAPEAGSAPPAGTGEPLHSAAAAGHRDAVLDALAGSRLFVLVARLHADTPGFTPPLPTQPDPAAPGRRCVTVLTSAALPPWHPDWVFEAIGLDELVRRWPGGVRWLAVDPGTPYAVTLEAGPVRRRAWLKAHARSGGPRAGLLLTRPTGPLDGPVARGLALGAHLAVHNGLVWNDLGAAYEGYTTDRYRLRRPWGVQDRAAYRETLETLLATRLVGRTYESVLRTRHTLARRLDRTPTVAEWSGALADALARRRSSQAEAAEAHEALRLAVTYEDRFRADGVLGEGERIDTLAAFDHGRAVNVVRLALGARLCDPGEAEQAVLRIGAVAAQAYGSWAEFSLGYSLARVLPFGPDDPSGVKYEQSLAQHRVLTRDPDSPYRKIAWS
ncbi:DUF1266 domain-containing protein [Streptomyces sp. NBC_01685]|uniref:DUF1266 domain-containing protein n=1 Tax=Streptomyces sp. NBC_01685 TaxID=2975910 RepID=UPI002E326A33|nr:DUF1266 domain-containing protein [Streptomyces sp. NBC_01685]